MKNESMSIDSELDKRANQADADVVGTVFDFQDLNPGTWYKFDDEDEKSADICIRALNPEKFSEIQKKTVKKSVVYKQGQRFEVREPDEDAQAELIWDYCIVDWRNVFDRDGNPIPVTKENKIKLMRCSLKFFTRVSKLIQRVSDELGIQEEREIKN